MRKNDNVINQIDTSFCDNDFIEIITIFGLAIENIKNKVYLSKDVSKITKICMTLLNYLYIITNIVNNSFHRNIEICKEKRLSELLIECFHAFCEKNVFNSINLVFEKLDLSAINTKAMIFRTLFHTITVIKNLIDVNKNALVIFI